MIAADRVIAPGLGLGPHGRLALLIGAGGAAALVAMGRWLAAQLRRHRALARAAPAASGGAGATR